MSKWQILQQQFLVELGFFKLRKDRCLLPDGREMPSYYVVEFPDWVNVVALTDKLELLMIRQYRHASEDCYWEVPGGSMDTRTGESPETAARRELLEETGYEPARMEYLGFHNPNPAFQNNRMHTFLALDCKMVANQNLDPFEDILVKCMSWGEVKKLMDGGEVRHSLILASLSLARPHIERLFNNTCRR